MVSVAIIVRVIGEIFVLGSLALFFLSLFLEWVLASGQILLAMFSLSRATIISYYLYMIDANVFTYVITMNTWFSTKPMMSSLIFIHLYICIHIYTYIYI